MRTKTLWIKEPYLEEILSGRKKIEVRVGYSNITRLQPGDRLMLNDLYPYRLHAICSYPSFEALLESENPAVIAPDLSRENCSPRCTSSIHPKRKPWA
jgi:ASC-1-like (ASCH) protein